MTARPRRGPPLVCGAAPGAPGGEGARPPGGLAAASPRGPARAGLERAVRVNPAPTPWFADDVAAVVAAGADALVIPKVESAANVHLVNRHLDEAERDSGRPAAAVRLLALVETPLGVLNAHAIATAGARLDALVIGHVD